MFHNSTTIWREKRRTESPFREKRIPYKFLEKAGAVWSGIVSKAATAKRVAMFVSAPIRWPLKPVTWAAKKTWGGMVWGTQEARRGYFIGREVTKSVGIETVAKPGLTLVTAPLLDVKMNLIDNARDIIGGTMRLPLNILRSPGIFLKESWNAVKDVRNSTVDLFKSLGTFKPMEILSASRHMLGSVLSAPFKPFYHTGKPYMETPLKVSRNILGAKLQYWTSLKTAGEQFASGIRSTIEAIPRGHQMGTDHVEQLRKKNAELAKKQDLIKQAEAQKELERLQKLGGKAAA